MGMCLVSHRPVYSSPTVCNFPVFSDISHCCAWTIPQWWRRDAPLHHHAHAGPSNRLSSPDAYLWNMHGILMGSPKLKLLVTGPHPANIVEGVFLVENFKVEWTIPHLCAYGKVSDAYRTCKFFEDIGYCVDVLWNAANAVRFDVLTNRYSLLHSTFIGFVICHLQGEGKSVSCCYVKRIRTTQIIRRLSSVGKREDPLHFCL